MPAGDSRYSGIDLFARRMLAAFCSGAISMAFWYPYDLFYTRLASDMNGKGQRRLYTNTFDCFNLTQLEGGFKNLYKGSLIQFCSILPMSIIMLPIYESVRPIFHGLSLYPDSTRLDIILEQIGASVTAGTIGMLIAYPVDTIKRWMQVHGSRGFTNVDKGIVNIVKGIRKVYGIRGFYKGAHIACLKVFPAAYIQFVIYEYIRKFTIMNRNKDEKVEVIKDEAEVSDMNTATNATPA